jgi:HSP20 family protein
MTWSAAMARAVTVDASVLRLVTSRNEWRFAMAAPGSAQQKTAEQQRQPSQQRTQGSPQQRGGELARRGEQGSDTALMRGGAQALPSLFRQMLRINDEMDRLFDSIGFGSLLRSPLAEAAPALVERGAVWIPEIEMFERDNQLVIRADLPGLNRDEVEVQIDNDQVIIRGERRYEFTDEQGGVYRSERSYGRFERVIPLPEGVNAENAEAKYRDGVLEITMPAPQRGEISARRLQIQEGSGGDASTSGTRARGAGAGSSSGASSATSSGATGRDTSKETSKEG